MGDTKNNKKTTTATLKEGENVVQVKITRPYPHINISKDRKESILRNTPAIFDIEKNPNADSDEAIYELDFFDEVDGNEQIFNDVGNKVAVDSDLLKAIAYMESTHGYYDKGLDILPFVEPSSFRPMNINYEEWKDLCKELGYKKTDIENNVRANIHTGAVLLKRIKERIENPTVEKIASIYNYIGREKTNDYGARVQEIYDKKLWKNN